MLTKGPIFIQKEHGAKTSSFRGKVQYYMALSTQILRG